MSKRETSNLVIEQIYQEVHSPEKKKSTQKRDFFLGDNSGKKTLTL